MKTNIDYFGHEVDAIDNRKFLILRTFYGGEKGWAMEAKFWALNCLIGKAEDCRLNLNLKGEKAKIARALDFSIQEFNDFIVVLRDEAELIQDDDGIIWTQKTQEDLKRAMDARYQSKNRRNGVKNDASPDDPKTSGDEWEKLGDVDHQSNTRQCNSIQLNSACSKPPAAAAISDKVVEKSLAGCSFANRFTQADKQAIANRLSASCLDAGFVVYCLKRTHESKARNPGGFLRSALLGSSGFEDYPELYLAERKPPQPSRTPPPQKCEDCKSVLRVIEDEAICPACGVAWVYDSAFEIWERSQDNYKPDTRFCMSG